MFLLAAGEWKEWVNYPGLEIWRFVNLAIFVVLGVYFLRTKISQALAGRRDAIRQEIIAAQTERERALARVAEADSLLSRLDDDVRTVQEQARDEAVAERQRVAAATDREIEKLKQQGQREIETAYKLARKELRQYLATRSVEFARESIRNQMTPEDDRALIQENIGDLRRTTV
jgi:F-type H+-transporting ATPase subunit b